MNIFAIPLLKIHTNLENLFTYNFKFKSDGKKVVFYFQSAQKAVEMCLYGEDNPEKNKTRGLMRFKASPQSRLSAVRISLFVCKRGSSLICI